MAGDAKPKAKAAKPAAVQSDGIELMQGNAKPPPKPEGWVARGGEKSARVDLAEVYSSRRGSNFKVTNPAEMARDGSV